MPNLFDQFDMPTAIVAPEGKNPFDTFDGNVFDQFHEPVPLKFASLPGNLKLNPLQQVQMQAGVDPELAGASLGSFRNGNDDVFLSSIAPPITAAAKRVYSLLSTPVTNYSPKETPEQQAIADVRRMALAQDVSPVDDDDGAGPSSPTERGILKGVGNLVNGFTSPIGLATLGLGGLPGWAQRAISMGFAAQMAKDAPEIATQLGTEVGKNPDDRDYEKIANLMTQGIGTVAMTSAAGLHGILGETPGPAQSSPEAQSENTAFTPNPNEAPANRRIEKPISQKIDDLAAAVKGIKDALTANQILPKPSEPTPIKPAQSAYADQTSKPAQDATVPPAPVASEQPDFSPSGESDLTPSKSQQIIQQAIYEKHAKAAKIQAVSEGGYRWNPNDIRIAKSTFRILSQERPQVFGNTEHDADFYQTQIAQRLRVLAKQHGTDVGF